MTRWPGQLGGSHKLVSWLNRLRAAAISNSVNQVFGGRMIESSDGKAISIDDYRIIQPDEFPFKIFQSGDWLTYQVRPGYVITNGEPSIPAGTTDDATEFTIDAGFSEVWFYLDLVAAPQILTTNITPSWAIDTIPIGWVDTFTHEATSAAKIYQFTHDNVFSPCVT